jgi:hypothetical protein
MREKGTRVGAIKSANETTVYLFGYGVYEGDEVPPTGLMNELGVKNPKIVLDNGKVIWGYQSWWGPEEEVRRMIGSREVIEV